MKIQDVLTSFDDIARKQFYDHDVRAALNQISEEDKKSDVYKYEMLAFTLVGNLNDSPWGTFYGPMMTRRAEDGTPVYIPSLSDVTNKAVLYWESRINKTQNPMMKMHYAGLVWDFKKRVCSDLYPKSLYADYITSMIAVVNGDYEPHDVMTVNVIERLDSFIGNDEQFKDKIKAALVRFDRERTKEDAAGRLWGAYIRFIIKHKSWFAKEEEQACVAKHEERLLRLSSSSINNPWATSEQCKVLADYYKSRGCNDDTLRVLLVMEQAYRNSMGDMNAFQWMGILKQVASTYAYYGYVDQRARLLKEIEEAGSKALGQMQVHYVEQKIPQAAFLQIDKILLEGNIEENFKRFCFYFLPNKDEQEKELKSLANQYPLVYMMSTQLMDEKGRPSSVIGGIESDLDGQLVLHMCRHIQIDAVFLRYGINKLRESGSLSIDYVLNRVRESPLIGSNRQEVIRQALLAYEADNFLTMCHLLIPQIEDAFRVLLDKSGKSVIRPQKDQTNHGFTQRILDDILKDSIVIDIFGENIAYYARILLTDQRGLNIRNNLCHGLVEPSFFNSVIADRLFHLFCIITLVH